MLHHNDKEHGHERQLNIEHFPDTHDHKQDSHDDPEPVCSWKSNGFPDRPLAIELHLQAKCYRSE